MAEATVDLLAAVRDGIYSDHPRAPEAAGQTRFRRWCAAVLKPTILA